MKYFTKRDETDASPQSTHRYKDTSLHKTRTHSETHTIANNNTADTPHISALVFHAIFTPCHPCYFEQETPKYLNCSLMNNGGQYYRRLNRAAGTTDKAILCYIPFEFPRQNYHYIIINSCKSYSGLSLGHSFFTVHHRLLISLNRTLNCSNYRTHE